MDDLEKKEIRGLSYKTFFTLFIGFGTLLSTILGTYFSIKNAISESAIERRAYESKTSTDIQEIKSEQAKSIAEREIMKGDIQYIKAKLDIK